MLAAVKDKPFGWPQERPSLTAAARDGEHITLVGTKECSLRAVEQKNGLISLMLGSSMRQRGHFQ